MASRYPSDGDWKRKGLEPDVGFLFCDGTSVEQAVQITVWSWLVGVVEAVSLEEVGW